MPIAENIYYQIYQKGDLLPVVLIHGAGGTHLYWPSEVRRLRGYQIYALDLPGHGKATGHGFQSISAYSRIIRGWMTAIGLHQAVFVGHSMGGAIAMTLALDFPEQVLGLGLVSTAPKLPVNPAFIENAGSPTTFHKAVDMLVKWSFSPDSPEQLRELAGKRMAETRPSVLHGDLLACDSFDIADSLGEIHQPSLVICGAEDKMTPLRYSLVLKDNLPSARLESIPAAGHMLMLEKPQEVAQALASFLGEIRF